LSLKGQRIIPKITQKREIQKSPVKSLQSIYTLARLASSSNRIRRSATASGPTIMDFMQCLNFKSRLDREKEMIRRKIRSSTLYKKPSFIKSSGFNIYNPLANGDTNKISCISKNIKINEFKDEPLRKIKSPLLVGGDEPDDECSNEEKSILCIGNKYLDLTSSLLSSVPLTKLVISPSTISLLSNELTIEKPNGTDFEKAISQSHLSPTIVTNKDIEVVTQQQPSPLHETFKNPKTAIKVSDNTINNDNKTPSDSNDGDDDIHDKQTQSLLSSMDNNNKRKDHKFIKKSNSHFYAVNYAKYSDAQKTEIETELLNQTASQTSQTTTHNASSTTSTTSINCASAIKTAAKKSGTIKKRSNKKSDSSSINSKNNSPKAIMDTKI
jgi:hypothetical protein